MKKILTWSGVFVVVILFVMIAGYNILDYNRRHEGGTTQTVNKPSFAPLAPMWDDALATEGRLDNRAIENHFNSARLEFFESHANPDQRIRIAYRRFPVPNEKGAIVISSGRTESMLIYQELIWDLNNHGYSVYIHDHRGQGLSGRLLDESQKSYIDKFDFYVADLKTSHDTVVEPNRASRTPPRLFLLAHSMGGGIASLYIEKYTHDFDAAALVTPMHAPKMPTIAVPGARVLSFLVPTHYALGQQGYVARDFIDTNADLTHSRTRFERIKEIYAAAAV